MKCLTFVVAMLLGLSVYSQEYTLLIKFHDKPHSGLNYETAREYLSEKAIERRKRSNIPINISDVPVYTEYTKAVANISEGKICYPLKWENALVLNAAIDKIKQLSDLPFVAEVRIIGKPRLNIKISTIPKNEGLPLLADYGASWSQIGMIGVQRLHLSGYTGKGMSVAVFDAGFTGVDTLPIFKALWEQDRIKGEFDYVDGSAPATHGSTHGTLVLSVMATRRDGQIIGTAPDADYYLYRTEDPLQERLLEEYHWARAAEHADSLGIDIINSSLGYTIFEDSTENHTYADLDGNSTPITRAANTAFAKGILVISSAGNSGQTPWYYISAPADGKDVLSVGAVNGSMQTAPFSSRGPNYSGQIKPELCAQGWNTLVANLEDTVQRSNGTSFSGPIIAGACASLWQAFPEFDNKTLKKVIEESGHNYARPDNECGYGIPDFSAAFGQLQAMRDRYFPISPEQLSSFALYPNPAKDFFTLSFFSADSFTVEVIIFDAQASKLFDWQAVSKPGNNYIHLKLPLLSAGTYFIQLNKGFEKNTRALIIY